MRYFTTYSVPQFVIVVIVVVVVITVVIILSVVDIVITVVVVVIIVVVVVGAGFVIVWLLTGAIEVPANDVPGNLRAGRNI